MIDWANDSEQGSFAVVSYMPPKGGRRYLKEYKGGQIVWSKSPLDAKHWLMSERSSVRRIVDALNKRSELEGSVDLAAIHWKATEHRS